MIHILYPYRQPVFQSVPNLKIGLAQMAATRHKEVSHGEEQYIEFCEAPCEKCRWNGVPRIEYEIAVPVYRGHIHTDSSNRPYVAVSHHLIVTVGTLHKMWFRLAVENGLYGNIIAEWLDAEGVRLPDGVVPYPGQHYPFAIEPIFGGDQWSPPQLMGNLGPMFRELVLASVLNIKRE